MDDTIRAALSRGGTIDITTTGRRHGRAAPDRDRLPPDRRPDLDLRACRRRGGAPGSRTSRRIRSSTVHLKGPIAVADLPATARIVDDEPSGVTILERVARAWRRTDVDRMVAQSPLIEVTIDRARAGGASVPPSAPSRRALLAHGSGPIQRTLLARLPVPSLPWFRGSLHRTVAPDTAIHDGSGPASAMSIPRGDVRPYAVASGPTARSGHVRVRVR